MAREPSAEQFLRDVQHHKMTVLHEDGIYRHVRFRQPDSGNMWFEIFTWPQHLTIAGDMGTWTFSRVEDMFKFFRHSEDEAMKINPSYWAEKLQNGPHSGHEAAKVFDPEVFGQRLLASLEGYGLTRKELKDLRAAVKSEILRDDSEFELISATYNFKHKFDNDDRREFEFESGSISDGKVYRYHFLWCLYAIVWAIRQVDARQPAPFLVTA